MRSCPACSLVNPPNAARCDCGYDFGTGTIESSYLDRTGRLDPNALRMKLKQYNMLSFATALPGMVLQIIGIQVGGLSGNMITLAGVALFAAGLGFYARMRGRSPWFCLLGVLSLGGMFTLYFLSRRCLNCDAWTSYKAKQCRRCSAPLEA